MASIAELEQQIRDFINTPRKQHALVQDTAVWNQLCSCMDTIGDTELAIDAFNASAEPHPSGAAYLLVYGILQALYIQQDSVVHLCEALKIGYSLNPLLKEIREIRNDSVGHPTKRGKGAAYNFIFRSSLTKNGFDLMTTYPDDQTPKFQHVKISSLISTQRDILQKALTDVVEKLKMEEATHRAKFRDDRLQDVFPPTLGYFFGKIKEAIHDSEQTESVALHIRLIADVLEKFKGKLQQRGILEAYDSVTYLLQLIHYPMEHLKSSFTKTLDRPMNENEAYIFVFFIEKHIEKLRGVAKEIDEDYFEEP